VQASKINFLEAEVVEKAASAFSHLLTTITIVVDNTSTMYVT
jgi:hypothetical protein